MGTFWELVMEYQLNPKFGKYISRFPEVGKYLEKQQVFFPIPGNLSYNFREDNFTQMGTFWELVMEYQLNHTFGKYFFLFPKVEKYLEKQQVFSPFLVICCKNLGKIISQQWEHFGNLKWNTNLIPSLGNNCFLLYSTTCFHWLLDHHRLDHCHLITSVSHRLTVNGYWL